MLLSILRKVSKLLLVYLLFANSVYADNVLVVHMNYVGPNVKTALERAGHTVTMSTAEVTDAATLAQYDQVWDTRYNTLSTTAATAYDTFVKNGGFLYLTTENPGCCQARNNVVAQLISNMGGGAGLTIGGAAGYASNTITQVNTTYMTSLNGSTLSFAAVSAITNYGNGQWLMKDAADKVVSVMWAGGAGNLNADYTGTVITVADINWIDNTRYVGTNVVALDDIIAGIVYGTVQGTITESGNSGGATVLTPNYSSGITGAQQTRRTGNLNGLLGHEANVTITGDSNDIYIHQAVGRHYVEVGVNGNSNTASVLQTGQGYTGVQHYLEVGIAGSNNVMAIEQHDTNKTAFVSVGGNYNLIGVNQKGTGNHYLDLTVNGNNHSATVVQDGSGSHNATVLLDGNQPWNFQLNQNGSTAQTYSLPHTMSDNSAVSGTCSAVGGCNLTVNQQ